MCYIRSAHWCHSQLPAQSFWTATCQLVTSKDKQAKLQVRSLRICLFPPHTYLWGYALINPAEAFGLCSSGLFAMCPSPPCPAHSLWPRNIMSDISNCVYCQSSHTGFEISPKLLLPGDALSKQWLYTHCWNVKWVCITRSVSFKGPICEKRTTVALCIKMSTIPSSVAHSLLFIILSPLLSTISGQTYSC